VSALPNSALGDAITKLAHEQIYVASRLGRMRISPHVYDDEADVARFVTTLTRATA
jgi:selenocysteine lyase/cysteine desulfurase